MYVFEQAVEHIESKKKRVMGMNEPMDLKEAYERIEWQIKYDVDNYDKDPTVAGIIDLERLVEVVRLTIVITILSLVASLIALSMASMR